MFRASWEPHGLVETSAVGAGLVVLAVGIGINVYALGSFLLMMRHVGDRGPRAHLRALLREMWVAALTQPLVPLFYLIGFRMDRLFARPAEGDGVTRVPVVFVHGYMQNRVDFVGLARFLARRGIGPLFGFNYPWFLSIGSNAKRLERFVERVCKATGCHAVDLVCHSMGGLVALEMMRAEASGAESPSAATARGHSPGHGVEPHRTALKVRRCVTIATPHAGVLWQGPLLGIGAGSLRRGSELLLTQASTALAVPVLSVYSTHDNIVHPKESASLAKRGGRDAEVEHPAHLAILFSTEVAEHVATFLAEAEPASNPVV